MPHTRSQLPLVFSAGIHHAVQELYSHTCGPEGRTLGAFRKERLEKGELITYLGLFFLKYGISYQHHLRDLMRLHIPGTHLQITKLSSLKGGAQQSGSSTSTQDESNTHESLSLDALASLLSEVLGICVFGN